MYYDLCPWRFCGCPYCVEVPNTASSTTTTLFPRIEDTTTTESSAEEEETTTPALETTTETETTESDTTTTEMMTTETEEVPETEEPITDPPRATTTPRPRTTAGRITVVQDCPMCICNTWSERIHLWHSPPPPRLNLRYSSPCLFCGPSWISGSFRRKVGFQQRWQQQQKFRQQSTRSSFNRQMGWLMNRWGDSSYGLGQLFGQRRSPVEVFPPQRSFNQPMFGNNFLFGWFPCPAIHSIDYCYIPHPVISLCSRIVSLCTLRAPYKF